MIFKILKLSRLNLCLELTRQVNKKLEEDTTSNFSQYEINILPNMELSNNLLNHLYKHTVNKLITAINTVCW